MGRERARLVKEKVGMGRLQERMDPMRTGSHRFVLQPPHPSLSLGLTTELAQIQGAPLWCRNLVDGELNSPFPAEAPDSFHQPCWIQHVHFGASVPVGEGRGEDRAPSKPRFYVYNG